MKRLITLILGLLLICSISFDVEAKRRKKRRAQRRPASSRSSYVKKNAHIDFNDMNIEGQNKKSAALYFLERQSKGSESRVKMRKNFRTEIMESL